MVQIAIMKSRATRRISQLVISSLVILTIVGFLFLYFMKVKEKALDTKKKMELTQLFSVIEMYYINEGIMPKNPNEGKWCIINEAYKNKKCLRELTRDGYIGSLPTSPNKDVYYYYMDDDMFMVATRINKLSENEKCPYSDEKNVWCKFFEKNVK